MEWLARWVRNLAFYFIFLSVLMNVIPQGEERKYIRFFMGLLLILVLIQPLLIAGQLHDRPLWALFRKAGCDRRTTGTDTLLGDTFGRNPAGI